MIQLRCHLIATHVENVDDVSTAADLLFCDVNIAVTFSFAAQKVAPNYCNRVKKLVMTAFDSLLLTQSVDKEF